VRRLRGGLSQSRLSQSRLSQSRLSQSRLSQSRLSHSLGGGMLTVIVQFSNPVNIPVLSRFSKNQSAAK
jgi:hypothetical protein